MFALDELRGLQVTYAELNGLLGYSPNKVVQGFTVLDEDRSAAIFDYLSVDSDTHPPAPTSADLAARIAALPAGTEAEVTVVRRLEQALLRRTLLPVRVGHCHQRSVARLVADDHGAECPNSRLAPQSIEGSAGYDA